MPIVKVLTGRGRVPLLHYLERQKNPDAARVLLAHSRNCPGGAELLLSNIEGTGGHGQVWVTDQIADSWQHTCEQHGTEGVVRKPKARYVPYDSLTDEEKIVWGEPTHVKRRVGRDGRLESRPARRGEQATHVRIEPDVADQKLCEAVHTIYSFSLDECDPNNPNDVRRAFEMVRDLREEQYGGLQELLVGQADGDGKQFHVHVGSNATVFAEVDVDGYVWQPGRKMSGALTDIEDLRGRCDDYMAVHPEYGYVQKLERYRHADAKRSPATEQMNRRGAKTRTQQLAEKVDEVFASLTPEQLTRLRAAYAERYETNELTRDDLDDLLKVCGEHGVEVKESGWRRDKPPTPDKRKLLFKTSDMKAWVSLKGRDYHSVVSDLIDIAEGDQVLPRVERQKPKYKRHVPTPEEIADWEITAAELAQAWRQRTGDEPQQQNEAPNHEQPEPDRANQQGENEVEVPLPEKERLLDEQRRETEARLAEAHRICEAQIDAFKTALTRVPHVDVEQTMARVTERVDRTIQQHRAGDLTDHELIEWLTQDLPADLDMALDHAREMARDRQVGI